MPAETSSAVAFFDVDGTLTFRGPDGVPRPRPTPRVEDAIRRFAAAGNVAAVCTGRSIQGIRELMELPFAGAVTLDGSHVVLGDRVVRDRAIPGDVFARTVREMRRVGMEAMAQGTYGSVLIVGEGDGELRRVLPGLPTLEEYEAAGGRMEFGKFDFIDSSLEACRSSDYLMGTYHYMDVGEGCHELAIPGVSKAAGARALIDALGFTPSRVYAFGDSENDLPVFEVADVAVAMGQASDAVKARAGYVTDAASDDGVATALERLGLV